MEVPSPCVGEMAQDHTVGGGTGGGKPWEQGSQGYASVEWEGGEGESGA